MIATPKLLIAIGVLAIALAVSVGQNVRQWSDARVAERAHADALTLAHAEGARAALAQRVDTSAALVQAAEQDRILLEAEREQFLAALQARERAYLARIADIELTCGPGRAFVDAFNNEAIP